MLRTLLALAVVLLQPGPGRAADDTADYSRRVAAVPTAAGLRAWHDLLASEPHVAGSDGDRRTVERLAEAFASFGMDVEVRPIWVYLARPVIAEVEIVAPSRVTLAVREERVDGDPYAEDPRLDPGWNAYSGSGDVTGEIVYANYGRREDFEQLATLGVDLRGKIVIARYGGNYRGYKARFAELAGAAALIIFTDPADAGYTKGLEYPEGGWANDTCIQRGSIVTLGRHGDPLTPFVEATEHADRLDPDEVDLPRIPVQPVGWSAAHAIMRAMRGDAVPDGWQGGLPLAYRLTGGEALRVRVHVKQRREITQTWNVIATLRGSRFPDERVIVGCHHDAWGFGAADPLAGMISLLEAARGFGELAAQGRPPARTLVFCGWAAEEFGIIGSSEWVEGTREAIERDVVAYLNLDMASMGPQFGAAASPSLRALIVDVAGDVPQARGTEGQTVRAEWLARAPDASTPGWPAIGDLGGGSDHVGFLCHAGVASMGFHGSGSKGTSYHSNYDNLAWYRQVVGEDYEPALMVGRMSAAALARLADAPVVPLDPARYGPETRRHLAALTALGRERGMIEPGAREIAPIFARIEGASIEFEGHAARVLEGVNAALAEGRLDDRALARINAALRGIDRAWLVDGGIPARPWFRNLYVSTDEDSGYASWMLPGLRWAIERGDGATLQRLVPTYVAAFDTMNERLAEIEAALR